MTDFLFAICILDCQEVNSFRNSEYELTFSFTHTQSSLSSSASWRPPEKTYWEGYKDLQNHDSRAKFQNKMPYYVVSILITKSWCFLSCSHYMRIPQGTSVCKPGRGSVPDTESSGTYILTFLGSRTVRNKCFLSHPEHSNLL